MTPDIYFTIEHLQEGLYKELGSRFISYAVPVNSEEEVTSFLDKTKKKYFDATHHCYAYIIGTDNKMIKVHDAGEPKHSAGTPILNQIKSYDITNVLVVVIRYFGGTKLGVSGLNNAYKLAAKSALENAGRIEKILHVNLRIQFQSETTGDIMKLLKSCKQWILDSHFESSNIMTLHVRASCEQDFRMATGKVKGVQII